MARRRTITSPFTGGGGSDDDSDSGSSGGSSGGGGGGGDGGGGGGDGGGGGGSSSSDSGGGGGGNSSVGSVTRDRGGAGAGGGGETTAGLGSGDDDSGGGGGGGGSPPDPDPDPVPSPSPTTPDDSGGGSSGGGGSPGGSTPPPTDVGGPSDPVPDPDPGPAPDDTASPPADVGGPATGGDSGGSVGPSRQGRDDRTDGDAGASVTVPADEDAGSGGSTPGVNARDSAMDPSEQQAAGVVGDPGGEENPSTTPAAGTVDGGRSADGSTGPSRQTRDDRGGTNESLDPSETPAATEYEDPVQGVETNDTPVGETASEFEQQVIDERGLSSEDVRITRDGDQLVAELTGTGETELRRRAVEQQRADAEQQARLDRRQQSRDADPGGSGLEGGDQRLFNEAREQRRQEASQDEQFGDIAVENPLTGNRVEEDLNNAADAFRDSARGVFARTGAVGTPGVARLAGTRDRSEVTEGVQGQFAESSTQLANVPQLAAEGKEVAEFAATQPQRAASEPGEFTADVKQRSTAIAESTAQRAQDNPAEFAIGTTVGLLGAAGAGRAIGSATRRASGSRVDLGSDVSGRAAQRASAAARRLGGSSRSAAGRAADAARGRTPDVSVERDPDAGLVEFEGDAPSLPSRPSASAVTDRVSDLRDRASTDTNLRDSAQAQAAVAASSARRSASQAVEAVQNAPGRARVAASRAQRRLGELPADARLEAAAARGRAADGASSLADRARPSFDGDLSVDRPLSDVNLRDSARAQAAVAASSARRRLAGAVPSRPALDTPDLDSPDVNLRQSAAAQAEVLAASAGRRAAAATEPIRNAPDRARIASDRAQRRLGDVRADAGLEAAAARARISDRLSSSRDGSALPSLDTPSLSGARDLTIRIGESDGPRRARVPDDTSDDLGPFADDDSLGELGALDETDTSGDSGLVDGPDVDGSRGSSGGPSALTLQRRGDADTPRPPGDRGAGRRDRPRDLERGVASGVAADQVFAEDARGPSVQPGVGPTDAVGAALSEGTSVGPTVEIPTDITSTETPDTATGTGLDTPTRVTTDTSTRTDLRQDTDVRSDLRVDTRADLDTRTDSRRRRNLDIDAPGSDDDGIPSQAFGGDEQRFENDTLDLL